MHVVISTVEENMNNNNLIIVAEDDDDIAAILTGYLRKAGMKTLRAEDGEQAINLTRLNKPDLLLLDIHLPVYDGWNVLTTLRKETNVPVIMVTALDQDVAEWYGIIYNKKIIRDYCAKSYAVIIPGLHLVGGEVVGAGGGHRQAEIGTRADADHQRLRLGKRLIGREPVVHVHA